MPGGQGAPVPRPTRSFVSQSGPRPLESLLPAHWVVSGAGDPRAQHWGGGGSVQSRTQAPERLLPVHRSLRHQLLPQARGLSRGLPPDPDP